ncbi:hypothetical protein SARC_12490 [Sphaeroforma arctica JP610]|uniref:Uncharacterized protein n=1 Tax=Sphaeroforma arctica JP610 TaxID=667725 RepID=A0A0L0FDY5_9EUKA|nr:hypothetical protein SARC_12490 [Sphaeroforma arctica JP610]KNC74974.1 hypothetical protein SARC_12490 [Sphaeroforma arctica JP610]|eukprot:XP_014148876.1 hypothetical protein SARC_12490 [Sphaeroforma arctica JP610]
MLLMIFGPKCRAILRGTQGVGKLDNTTALSGMRHNLSRSMGSRDVATSMRATITTGTGRRVSLADGLKDTDAELMLLLVQGKLTQLKVENGRLCQENCRLVGILARWNNVHVASDPQSFPQSVGVKRREFVTNKKSKKRLSLLDEKEDGEEETQLNGEQVQT